MKAIAAERFWIFTACLAAVLALAASPMVISAAAWTAAVGNPGNSFSTAASFVQSLYVWGAGNQGRTGALLTTSQSTTAVRAPGLENWASVSTGNDSTCAITSAGALYCWGYNGYGQLGTGDTTDHSEPVAIAVGTTWSAVSKGYVDTCAIKSADSTLWCWGYNPDGQVGNGTTASPVLLPVQVTTTGLSTWSSISLGQYFACGIKTDATLWCWGYGGNGRTGAGGTANLSIPTQIGSSTWTTVSAGYESACAIRASTSTLWCWGDSAFGQLGNGTTTPDISSPAQSGVATWSALAAGQDRACGLRVNSTVWCWGYGGHGGNGNGATSDVSTPVQESTGNTTWTKLTAMSYGACATRGSGALYCWGQNTDGELGDASTTDRSSPVASGTITDWRTIDGGADQFCGVRSADGGLWCQGDDLYGKIGHDYNDHVGAPTPLSPPNSDWTAGSTGYEGGCGIRRNGTLWCWGDNGSGETGLGDSADHIFPQQVGAATDWASASTGTFTACGLRTNGSMYCMGEGVYNQFGTGSTTDQNTPTAAATGTWAQVSVGETHTCGISTAGALSCWGQNAEGQVGNSTTATQALPATVLVIGVTTWASVSAGYYSTCAIVATGLNPGALYCWGRNTSGQVGNGNTTSPQSTPVRIGTAAWSSAVVGRGTVCGLQTSGRLYCWGLNDYGQLGNGGAAGTPNSVSSPQAIGALTTWTDVAVGWGFACATRTDSSAWCWGRDDDGQLGDRGSVTVTTPQRVPGLTATMVDAHTSAEAVLALG